MLFAKKVKFVPTKYRVEGCTSQATFSKPSSYKVHLRTNYEIDNDEMKDYLAGLAGY